MSKPSPTPPSPLLSEIFTPDRYQQLITHAQLRRLGQHVPQQMRDIPTQFLAELYATDFDLKNLWAAADPKLQRLHTPDMSAAEQRELDHHLNRIQLVPAKRGSMVPNEEELNQLTDWLHKNVPDASLIFARQPVLAARRLLIPRLGGDEAKISRLTGFLNNAYSGYILLHLSTQLAGVYTAYMHQRQHHFEAWHLYDRNIWAWHAAALSDALWLLDISTHDLDQIIHIARTNPKATPFQRLTGKRT